MARYVFRRPHHGFFFYVDRRTNAPMSASLTPFSAPLSPLPRKGSITPGESNEYTSGDSESLSRVESARVSPGWADVRSALGVAGIKPLNTGCKKPTWSGGGGLLTARYPNISKRVQQCRFSDVGHADDEHVHLGDVRAALGYVYDTLSAFPSQKRGRETATWTYSLAFHSET